MRYLELVEVGISIFEYGYGGFCKIGVIVWSAVYTSKNVMFACFLYIYLYVYFCSAVLLVEWWFKVDEYDAKIRLVELRDITWHILDTALVKHDVCSGIDFFMLIDKGD